ncbi:MAG: hypothetical protein ACE5JF_11845 [Anaerolineales bacterium]
MSWNEKIDEAAGTTKSAFARHELGSVQCSVLILLPKTELL